MESSELPDVKETVRHLIKVVKMAEAGDKLQRRWDMACTMIGGSLAQFTAHASALDLLDVMRIYLCEHLAEAKKFHETVIRQALVRKTDPVEAARFENRIHELNDAISELHRKYEVAFPAPSPLRMSMDSYPMLTVSALTTTGMQLLETAQAVIDAHPDNADIMVAGLVKEGERSWAEFEEKYTKKLKQPPKPELVVLAKKEHHHFLRLKGEGMPDDQALLEATKLVHKDNPAAPKCIIDLLKKFK
jgi:hypothetical protein